MKTLKELALAALTPTSFPTMHRPTLIAEARARKEALAEMHERLSPATMLLVLEALERAKSVVPDGSGADQKITAALSALNNPTP